MIAPEDSLVTPNKSSPGKAVVAVLAVAGIAGAGLWLAVRGKGQPEDPARVLIVGPSPELAGFLENEGFDATHLSVGEAIGEGQTHDPSLDGLAAMVEYADQSGIGYLALNMALGETYEFAAAGYGDLAPPPGTTFAVVSIGDLGRELSYGAVVPEVVHDRPAGEEVGLLLALFAQSEITKARTREASNDLMIRFGSAGTVADVEELEQGQENMRRQIAAWDALAAKERGEPKPTELAGPYELLRGWPLANGELLVGAARDAWYSPDGERTKWREGELDAALSVAKLDDLTTRSACPSLPETLAIDGGFAVAPAGDALLIPSERGIADLWVLSGEGCGFEKRDQIRRLEGGELGKPRASGRTAESLRGQLTWADAKMRAYRQVRLDGVELRDGELRWATDDTVVAPASLDFGIAATARARRVAFAAAAAAGQDPPTSLEPVDPSTAPPGREALIFARLPPPKQNERLEIAVLPVDALLAASGTSAIPAPGTLSIRDLFPLPASPGVVVALVDGPDGSRLVRAALVDEGAWHDALAVDYDLAAAIELPKGALETQVLADALPHEAHDLALAPDGSHAAWAAPFGEARDSPLANFEIVLLALGVEGATPIRLTDNDRSDLRPRFAGPTGATVVFETSYVAADDLPPIESLRALPVPARP